MNRREPRRLGIRLAALVVCAAWAGIAAPPSWAQGDPDRPLGTLISPTPEAVSGSVLPSGWNAGAATGRGAAPAPTAPPAAANAARPLGTLIAPTPALQPGPELRPPSPAARPIRPAQRVQPAPAPGASAARPLGTLIGPRTPEDAGPSPVPVENVAPAPSRPNGAIPTPARGETPEAEFSADNLTYDRDLGIVTATGNVEVIYEGRILRAQRVTYNQKTDVVQAIDDVSLTDADGEVLLGDRMDVTGDLKDGVIYNIGLVLADRARVAGTGARRSGGNVTEIAKGVYSPCEVCAEDPSAAPLWQLKAVRVTHYADQQRVEYRDVWLEAFGIPVAYVPYLSHPDPTVKRRSGFLAPSLSSSTDLGFRVQAPYFWAIDENQDATITPLITTDGGSGSIAQYRARYARGTLDVDGSFVANDPDKDFRGFIDLESQYHINRTWRAGVNIERASDDTYTRRYGFDTETVLESRAYLEGFRGNNYQALNLYAFQDLRPDSVDEDTPFVVPVYDFNFDGERDRLGGYSSFDFNVLNLARDTGPDTRRIAFRPRWDRPFNGPFGEVYNASVALAADAYHATDVTLNNGETESGFAGRLHPRAALSWRLPLIRPAKNFSQTIEPIASVVVSPNGGNPDEIPNEDSQEIEFDETNLFQEDVYDGFDRIDGGTRVNYGVNWVGTSPTLGTTSVFLGQSYRPRIDATFARASGQTDNFSDVVGRVQIQPRRYLDLTYRTQLSADDLAPVRNELNGTIGNRALNLSTNYIMIDRQPGSEFPGREEISNSVSSQINRYWSASFSSLYDISTSDMRSLGLRVVYEDECLRLTTLLSRSFYEDRDLKPSDSITFTLVLKTLGEIRSGVSRDQ